MRYMKYATFYNYFVIANLCDDGIHKEKHGGKERERKAGKYCSMLYVNVSYYVNEIRYKKI